MSGDPSTSTQPSWPQVLSALTGHQDLSDAQSAWAMGEILQGAATPAQIAGFAVALRTKGESVEELSGLVDAMYAHAVPLPLAGRWLDVVGTGGDRSMSVNISTMSALVAAAAGAPVVKHGNRSASSRSGAADVLEALGVRLDLTPAGVAEVAEQVGITFAFAPAFHPALRHAAAPRRELAVATTFNFLGPLANPARPAAQAVGCADPAMAPLMAGVFARRGVDAWVFRGDDGLDELSLATTSRVWAVHAGEVTEHVLHPDDVGLATAPLDALRGGDAEHNAAVVRRLVEGEAGPVRDAVLLNAGAALAVHAEAEHGGAPEGAAEGAAGASLSAALADGVAAAAKAIDDGSARSLLERWVTATVEIAQRSSA